MRIKWRPEARAELAKILRYIGERNIQAATRLSASIKQATSALPVHPDLYRKGRSSGTREIVVHPNYLVIYEVADQIEILSVLHTRQEYP
ncbi:type II toxin-antitoxin system RelE/ParE family toxin [Pseudomonas sp. FP2196]|uniref:type II toxin-antitoxin system RelE/ParE family toxin n=1 Tax=unclassified Pseudomonas TaxID=196821 RepID=UPI00273604B5|nr:MULTISPECIES: type II toxin-antitoxin system RelE/ParE family toxin [unclassified Pseudomonas]MDT3312135.1 type II toxin-antitoxin system RelE/ParE family toxin [Pseudomonas sp. rhizo66]WLH37674.1 type II toxin-antitoxin system RelE/ParE family toxin [Pseudomonas sp. FP2196]